MSGRVLVADIQNFIGENQVAVTLIIQGMPGPMVATALATRGTAKSKSPLLRTEYIRIRVVAVV